MRLLKHCSLLVVLITQFSISQEASKVFVFSKTEDFRHKSIESGLKAIEKLGRENSFEVYASEDAEVLSNTISEYNVLLFLNTTGNILNDSQQLIIENFIKNGGGFVGVHSATDTEYDWPWYGKMVGAYFLNHPKPQQATLQVKNSEHSSTCFMTELWVMHEEWYNFKEINPAINVLLSLDEKSYEGGKNGDFHPIAWYHEYDGGKVFYTGIGHSTESYVHSLFLKHLLGGIQYALGNQHLD